ncbi:MAG: response regulator [Robiginitomaculum sp.]|nr:response regulator [Robiginitomaculum sp.]
MDIASLFQQLPDLVVCRDRNRKIKMVNMAFISAFGNDHKYWIGRKLDDATCGAQIGAFDENRAYGNLSIDDKLYWVEWVEIKLEEGGTVSVGRLNADRRKDQRSTFNPDRDRRKNQTSVYAKPAKEKTNSNTNDNVPARTKKQIPPAAKTAMRVLLAEDDLLNAKLARTLLERTGCLVTHVEDGVAAVDAAKQSEFDLVFMDIRMPKMDGLSATKAIRALGGKWAEIPIVALTANAFAEDKTSCHKAGMNGFLTKPISIDALAAASKRWTEPQNRAKLG